jgi:hypothetical protein
MVFLGISWLLVRKRKVIALSAQAVAGTASSIVVEMDSLIRKLSFNGEQVWGAPCLCDLFQ